MPIVSGGGGGGGLTSPIASPAPLVFTPANPATVAMQFMPASGATADATDQLEVYDDGGNLVAYIDANGSFEVFAATTGIGDSTISLAAGLTGDNSGGRLFFNSTGMTLLAPASKWIKLASNDGATVGLEVTDAGAVIAAHLPTSDPGVSGQLYSVAGVVHVSP